MTDEELEDTMWEAARPWEEQWEALNVNESKVEEQEIDDDDRHFFGVLDRETWFAIKEYHIEQADDLRRRRTCKGWFDLD